MAKLPKDLEEAQKKAEAFEETVKDLTLDRCNEAAKVEEEPQTKLSQQELSKKKEIYLKPKRSFSCKGKFNEKFRDDYEFKKEYVCFIAENREIIGETISLWTKPFPGVACEEWEVPTNKPVWGPRYLAERIKGCSYHRFTMQHRHGR
jgi:hypothetical protein